MPVFSFFLGSFLGGLISIAGTLAGQVLIGLGISVVTYSGMASTLDWLKAGAVSALLGLPAEVVAMLSLMKVGVCVSMVFSAISVRLVINGLTGDTFKRWVKK